MRLPKTTYWMFLDARGADGKAKADRKADGKADFKADCTDGNGKVMVGRVFLVLTGACQFGHGVGGFTTN